MDNKIKVVWICHFSNAEVRNILPLSNMRVNNFIRRLAGKQIHKFNDFAPWVNSLIKEFEKFNEVELHIIAPHKGLKPARFEFEMNGVYYHFYKPELSFPFNKIEERINKRQKTEFLRNRIYINNYINQIKPDIVNVIGSENPYYSIAALDIEGIPVYLSAQTVYTNPKRIEFSGSVNQLKWDIELKIHKKVKYYGCTGRMHRDLILNNNDNAIVFKMFFPMVKPINIPDVPKEFDFVFFASGVTPKKGIEDAFQAMALVKKNKPKVSLNIVGKCSAEYRKTLDDKIVALGLSDNITFEGYFPQHQEMLQHIKKGKFALLPVKLDNIPGTVVEAMMLEIPVITYRTMGMPYLNKDGETVLLADIGDIEGLAGNMNRLLDSPTLEAKLKTAAKLFVEAEFDDTVSANRLLNNYRAVIDHFHWNTPIPDELLFNPKEFPIYL